jgi:hypothetical protein
MARGASRVSKRKVEAVLDTTAAFAIAGMKMKRISSIRGRRVPSRME